MNLTAPARVILLKLARKEGTNSLLIEMFNFKSGGDDWADDLRK